jgi:hypothetical protein
MILSLRPLRDLRGTQRHQTVKQGGWAFEIPAKEPEHAT